ncbi:exocyst complex component EXO70H1 [Setaria italica]|nr:exocyst complex component EXO70H1 [Setaria italica]
MASPSPRRHALPPPGHHRRTLSSTLVDESVAAAAALVHKWHPDDAPAGGSLFLHGAEEDEARRFLRAAADLHRAMLFFASDVAHGSSHGLVEAQALLQTAMRRLDLELRVLLDDIDSIQSDHAADASRSRNNICAVAEAMMAAGYGKECISTFKTRRRAALTASLRRLLGFSPPVDHLHKITWDQLDARIIPSWLAAATAAFGSLFPAEKDLCDAVFAGDNAAVGEAVFAAVANDQATGLLAVTEAAAARARRAPERLFRVLDVHDALTEALPALLSVFGDGSEVAARAALSVAKVGEAARGALGSLEAAIQKEPSKATAAGGAVHPLTRYVMNYVVFLADYKEGLALLYDYDYDSDSSEQASPSVIHRLVSALLSKLEAKAGCYREAALSYLFLANNTRYVANKVAGSGQLRGVLGDGWAEAQSAKARAHVGVYVRAAWGKVTSLCTQQGGAEPEAVEAAVMESVGMQEQWVAADDETGEALRAAATAAVVPKYRMFYRRHGAAVRLTPGDVTAMIAALFGGPLDLVSQRHQEDPNPYRDPTRSPRQLFT